MYRILHFVSNVATRSGVMSVIMNYYRYIDRKNIQFDFVYFDEFENNYKDEIERLEGRVFKVRRPSIGNAFSIDLRKILLHEGEFGAIHNHEVYLTVLINDIAKKSGINRMIVHCHATKWSDHKISALRNKVLCLPLKWLPVERFSCSEAAGEFLYKRKDYYVLYNAVDVNKFKYSEDKRIEMRKTLDLDGKLVIGHVGRYNEQKNHMFLIDIFNEISKREKQAVLLLVGDGPLEKSIKEKVENLKLGQKVVFLGTRRDVPEILQAMDIFVLPSLYEGFPVVGVEAQCAGLPVFMSSSITKEADLVDVSFVKLTEGADVWAKNILLKCQNAKERERAYKIITEKGYDIAKAAQQLNKKYVDVIEAGK